MCYYLPRHVKTYKLFKISAILILSSWLPDLLSDRQRLRFFGLKDVLLYLGSCNSSTCFLFWDRIEFGTASIKWIFVGLVASTRTFDQLVHPDDSVAKEWAEATKGWSWAQNQGPRWSQNLSSGHRWTTPFLGADRAGLEQHHRGKTTYQKKQSLNSSAILGYVSLLTSIQISTPYLAVSNTPPEPAPHWNCQKMPRSFDGAPSWAHHLMSIWRKQSICHNLWHISCRIAHFQHFWEWWVNDGLLISVVLWTGELVGTEFRKFQQKTITYGPSCWGFLSAWPFSGSIWHRNITMYLSSKRSLVVITMTGLSCLMDGVPEPEIWPGTNTTKWRNI